MPCTTRKAAITKAEVPVVSYSFHFNAPIAPEARTAYPWIMPAIARLKDRYQLIGHAHPRMFEAAKPRYERLGIEAVRDFADVCRRADLYICDNSSTLFAFAATGRPVVVLNPPWYDRKIDHGLRFWEASEVGVNCNDPASAWRRRSPIRLANRRSEKPRWTSSTPSAEVQDLELRPCSWTGQHEPRYLRLHLAHARGV
jgi:hypothetical protein